jgi:hypothetical protein
VLPYHSAYKERHPDEAARDLIPPLLVHVGLWSAIGAASGLALAIGLGARGRVLRCVLGTLAGATLGAIAYDLISSVVFPLANTAQIVSESWQSRLFARLLVALLAAVGAAVAAGETTS